MNEAKAIEHIKKQYQKLFQKPEKAQELFDYITDNGKNVSKFVDRFEVSSVNKFIKGVVSDLTNSDLYGFINVK